MLSAAFKYAVINQIKLNSCSLPVHNEHYVITFHNLVVPASSKMPSLSKFKEESLKLRWNAQKWRVKPKVGIIQFPKTIILVTSIRILNFQYYSKPLWNWTINSSWCFVKFFWALQLFESIVAKLYGWIIFSH